MFNALRRLIQRYGFFRKTVQVGFLPGSDNWIEAQFYTEEKRRNERLAQIARERDALKVKLAKAIKQKKARQPIYLALRALSIEELNIGAGR